MNTRLAAQVFSTTVTRVLSSYGPADAARAANFCLMFNKYFVTMNVSCTAASSLELKLYNTLYMSTNVMILVFLYGCASNSNIIQNQKVFKPIATG